MINGNSNNILETRLKLDSLCIYTNLLKDPVVGSFYALLDCSVSQDVSDDSCQAFIKAYSGFFNILASNSNNLSLIAYVIEKILYDENPFTTTVQQDGSDKNNPFEKAVKHDLDALQAMTRIEPDGLKTWYLKGFKTDNIFRTIINSLPAWNCSEHYSFDVKDSIHTEQLAQYFLKQDNWSDCYGVLVEFHKKNGCGIFAKYKAFIWQCSDGATKYVPVKNPDPVRLTDLIDYESERYEVIKNTEYFLKGLPANNVLLYGDRGTGKSSTVKAILNEYHTHGLRVIEIPKNNLVDFQLIVGSLGSRNQKFILFVDDLAFEDNEENYTALKAVLEGSLETKPDNVLIYATSNRRHLIKEKFSDRAGLQYGEKDDEVRAYDTIQEKLSLSDRFGITVVFSSPDKSRYLHIIEELAARNGLNIDKDELHKEALKWELWYNGRSPRTAQQFITWLKGIKTSGN